MTDRVEHIAKEVAGYLARHPDAADTAEGIAQWWLSRQGSTENIEKAPVMLIARGIVSKRIARGKAIFLSGSSGKITSKAGTCPHCSGAVKIIACIEDPVVIEKILAFRRRHGV